KEGDLPPYAFIEGYESQMQWYTLDCEARAAVDFAAFFGVQINENDFLDNLPRSDDPNEGFVGEINGPVGNIPPFSYGVYANPIANLLRDYGLNAAAVHGMSMRQLKSEIAAGRPVIVWVVGAVEIGYPETYYPASGNPVTVVAWEHVVTVVGYDEDLVYVIDPTYNYYYSRWIDNFKSSWKVLGNMAVIYQPE
ncbi:MAG: C39 family peptidase, partial [Anaerolineaceae bacterium]